MSTSHHNEVRILKMLHQNRWALGWILFFVIAELVVSIATLLKG